MQQTLPPSNPGGRAAFRLTDTRQCDECFARFDPERFNPATKQDRPDYAYFPFGGGSRICIGEPFARMEGVLLIAAIAQRFKMMLIPGQTIVPEPLVTLRPKYGIRMMLIERE